MTKSSPLAWIMFHFGNSLIPLDPAPNNEPTRIWRLACRVPIAGAAIPAGICRCPSPGTGGRSDFF